MLNSIYVLIDFVPVKSVVKPHYLIGVYRCPKKDAGEERPVRTKYKMYCMAGDSFAVFVLFWCWGLNPGPLIC
jgi:hypothetical protein